MGDQRVSFKRQFKNWLLGMPESKETGDGLPPQRDWSLRSSERQTGSTLADIRFDHRVRYELAADRLLERLPRAALGLDLFCGTGYGTYLMSKRVSCSVMGMDASREAVEFGGKHFSNRRTIYAHKVFPFELPRSTFDFITCFESLEHVEDWHLLLDEVSNALKPDGVLLLSCPNEAVLSLERNPNKFHIRHFEVHEILEQMSERGLRNNTWWGQDAYLLENGKATSFLSDDEVHLHEEKIMQFAIFEFQKTAP